jgi:hypothetical protein
LPGDFFFVIFVTENHRKSEFSLKNSEFSLNLKIHFAEFTDRAPGHRAVTGRVTGMTDRAPGHPGPGRAPGHPGGTAHPGTAARPIPGDFCPPWHGRPGDPGRFFRSSARYAGMPGHCRAPGQTSVEKSVILIRKPYLFHQSGLIRRSY